MGAMKTKQRPIDMPIKSVKCSTCPFGPNGCVEVRESVKLRILNSASQTCHSTGVAIGKRRDTHLCRGARDFQLHVLHGMGFLSEPTDEAWREKCKALGIK